MVDQLRAATINNSSNLGASKRLRILPARKFIIADGGSKIITTFEPFRIVVLL